MLKPNPQWRGDPTFLPAVFKAFSVRFTERPGWKDWGMGDFGRIQAVMWHHTGANNTSPQFVAFNPMLENALSSQLHVARNGLITILGAGIAWHAGRGSKPGWPTNNANAVSIGFEMQGDGTSPWPEEELEQTRRATAAILWFLGKRATPETMISHYEWAGRAQGKWDPGAGDGIAGHTMNMDYQRAKVNELIDRFNRYGSLDRSADPANQPKTEGKHRVSIEDLIMDQLAGPENKPDGTPAFTGWKQLGGKTLVDAVAEIRNDVKDIKKKLEGE